MNEVILGALITSVLGLVGIFIKHLLDKSSRKKQTVDQYRKRSNELDYLYFKSFPYITELKTNHYKYKWKDKSKNTCNLDIRTLMSLKSLRNGDLTIRTPLYSQGKITPNYATSEPGRDDWSVGGISQESNNDSGFLDINLYASEKYKPHLVLLGTIHEVILGAKQNVPSRLEYPILWKLYTDILKSRTHAFVGTMIMSPTNTLRFLIDFEPEMVPSQIYTISITEELEKKDPKPYIAKLDSSYLIEFHDIEVNSGIYAWWQWSDEVCCEEEQ